MVFANVDWRQLHKLKLVGLAFQFLEQELGLVEQRLVHSVHFGVLVRILKITSRAPVWLLLHSGLSLFAWGLDDSLQHFDAGLDPGVCLVHEQVLDNFEVFVLDGKVERRPAQLVLPVHARIVLQE